MNHIATIKNYTYKLITSPTFIVITIYLFIQLQLFNIGIDIQDEGFSSYLASLIVQGQIPYKDFVLTPTPGIFYLLAYLFKIFGNYLILDRIVIFFSVISIVLVNSIFKLSKPWKFLLLFSIAAIHINPTNFVGHNNAIEILLAGLLFLIKGLENKSSKYIFITGLLASLTFIFKQSFGFLTLPAFLLIILLFCENKYKKRFLISYVLGTLIPLLIFFGYFYFIGSLKQLIYYVFIFASQAKGHETSFIIHRLIFIPIFFVSVKILQKLSFKNRALFSLILLLSSIVYFILEPRRFGRLIDYLVDPIFYIYSFITIIPLLVISFSNFNDKKERIYVIYSIVLFVLFLGIAGSGYSSGVLYAAYPMLIPLFIYFSQKYLIYYLKSKIIINFLIATSIVLCTIYLSFNPITYPKYYKDIFILNKYNQEIPIKEGKFIRVTEIEKKEFNYVINYIKTNSTPKQKIFCFPLCPTLYFLTERNNATSYNIIYPETFLLKDQEKAIKQLQKNKAVIIVVQKIEDPSSAINIEKNRYNKLYLYILSKYKLKTSTEKYDIYK